MVLYSDRPKKNPTEDLFGHAFFARNLAKGIRNYSSEDGLVMALYGPWGSGKTTVLNYTRHYLKNEAHGDEEDFIVVDFNPWWFSGREDLAQAFLGQLQTILPSKSEKLKDMAGAIGDFSASLGRLVDLSGKTLGAGTILGDFLAKVLKRNPTDVPALKAKIVNKSKEAKIHRLTFSRSSLGRLNLVFREF